jgi:UDP-glucose 4-epimerase
VLKLGATILGQARPAARLLGTLQVSTARAQQVLAWQPRIDVDEALRRAANAFAQELV